MRKVLISNLVVFAMLGLLSSCGVKGKPLPPTTPPVLGRGEPNFSKATGKLKLKKKKNPKIEGDFDEPSDFSEGDD